MSIIHRPLLSIAINRIKQFIELFDVNQMTYWSRVGSGFCENLIDGYPEKVNSYTSLGIVFIGLYGLYGSKLNFDLSRMIYSGMACAGVGSFLFHWYGYALFGMLDILPMMGVSWMVNYFVWTALFGSMVPRYGRMYDWLADTIALSTSIGMYLFMATNTVRGIPLHIGFTESFAIPQASTLVGTIFLVIRHCSDSKLYKTHAYIGLGMFIMALSAALWVGTEPYCEKDGQIRETWMAYTHGVWHIGFSYGAHLAIQALFDYRLVNKGTRCGWKSGKWFAFFPITKTC